MKKTLDFNKLAKALKAKKAWEKVQEEKNENESELTSKQDTARRRRKSQTAIRKSS